MVPTVAEVVSGAACQPVCQTISESAANVDTPTGKAAACRLAWAAVEASAAGAAGAACAGAATAVRRAAVAATAARARRRRIEGRRVAVIGSPGLGWVLLAGRG